MAGRSAGRSDGATVVNEPLKPANRPSQPAATGMRLGGGTTGDASAERGQAPAIDEVVARARAAAATLRSFTQEQVDAIVKAMAIAGLAHHEELARLAVEETGMGVYEDKVQKNLFATEYVYNDIREQRTVGVLRDCPQEGYMEVAEPIGVIAGITPVTNPTATTLFKSLISLKTRNAIVFSFHPKALRCSAQAARIMREAAVRAGAPADCIQWLEPVSLETTQALMRHPGVDVILATGGAGMVQAAYSSGKPALGVGPGNVPAYIERSADLRQAVADIVLSKTFDNGMICASEQAVIVDAAVDAEVRGLFTELGCYFLTEEEAHRLEQVMFSPPSGAINPAIVGQSATRIAQLAGISVPAATKVLLVCEEGVGPGHPFTREKLSPVLAYLVVHDYREGVERCRQMTEYYGVGHTAVLHSQNPDAMCLFREQVRAGRLLINQPSALGAIGDLYNFATPSLTLGCGTMGHNSTTANVSVQQLLNVKRVTTRRPRMQWLRIPPEIYFEPGAIQYLAELPARRAFIVTDPTMVKLGYVERAKHFLDQAGIQVQVFSDVEPDPSVDTVRAGAQAMTHFEPDCIIALGGGSAMDAAKGMWMFYEHPEARFDELRLKFLFIRKRTVRFPHLGGKALFVAIPTTSGTGSEGTAFAVITDRTKNVKYPVTDYEFTPDVAIIDPDLVMTVPPRLTADTGVDALVHAIEAYVSVMASDFTDGLALHAAELIFTYLPRAYRNGNDRQARTKMHYAATIAGLAFSNAFLGINHSLAHVVGARFHVPHGRANAVLLPYVIRYNAALPSKLVAYPQYSWPRAAERYAELARRLGLPAGTAQEGVASLLQAVDRLLTQVEMPRTFAAAGVDVPAFLAQVDEMAEIAFNDQCTGVNPRLPLVHELAAILREACGAPESSPNGVTVTDARAKPQSCSPAPIVGKPTA